MEGIFIKLTKFIIFKLIIFISIFFIWQQIVLKKIMKKTIELGFTLKFQNFKISNNIILLLKTL